MLTTDVSNNNNDDTNDIDDNNNMTVIATRVMNDKPRECSITRASNYKQMEMERHFNTYHQATVFTLEAVFDNDGKATNNEVEVLYERRMAQDGPEWYRAEATDDGASGTFSNDTEYDNGALRYRHRHDYCFECGGTPCLWAEHRATIIPTIE